MANPLSTVGLMLTLAGLVGSFFNIQLSQWLRDLLALEQKVTLNRAQGTEPQQRAIVECRVEYTKLTNLQNYVLNILIIAFVLFVLVDGLCMIRGAQADPLYPNINLALWVFLVFFIGVSGWLTFSGWLTSIRIRNALN
jgi:hypothetical protein